MRRTRSTLRRSLAQIAGLALAWIALATSAKAVTFVSSTPIAGDSVPVTLTIADAPEGDAVDVTVSIPDGAGDLLGLFGNAVPESLVAMMAVVDATGVVTQSQFAVNQVWKVGGGNVMAPVKHWDWGLRFGSAGSAGGVLSQMAFRLSAPGLTAASLTEAFNQGWRFGVRIQSTTGPEGSAKIGVAASQPPQGAPPTIAIASPADGSLLATSEVTVTGSVSGTLPVTVAVNGALAQVTDGHFSALVPLAEGANTLVATAENAFGTAVADLSVSLDSTSPALTVDMPADGVVTIVTPISVHGTASDEGGLAAVILNGTAIEVSSGVFSMALDLALGINTATIVARDLAGNETTVLLSVIFGVCLPGDARNCYSGPPGTEGVGRCVGGVEVCVADGSRFGPCTGEVVPIAETCNGTDDDCDAVADDGFDVGSSCDSGLLGACNAGALVCRGGESVCEPLLVPSTQVEICNDGIDQDCDGRDCAPLFLEITSPEADSVTDGDAILVTGSVGAGAAEVLVNDLPLSVGGEGFAVSVPLRPGQNVITASASDASGNTGTASVIVVRDNAPPLVNVQMPRDGARVATDSVVVTGSVHDAEQTIAEPVVTVNGIPAVVENGTYMLAGVPLFRGPNTLAVVASDAANNSSTVEVEIFYDATPRTRLEIVSGDIQEASTSTTVPEPLVVRLIDEAETPLAAQPVQFAVSRNNGSVSAVGGDETRVLNLVTGADGTARAILRLGNRAGEGSNRVAVTSPAALNEVEFCASGRIEAPDLIVPTRGDNQTGAVGRPLAEPFEALVVDAANNPVIGVPVTFTVEQGGGHLDGSHEQVVFTDRSGLARSVLTLGPEPGVLTHVVRATFPNPPEETPEARWAATALTAGAPEATSFAGVLLDSTERAIPGATVHIRGTALETLTREDGSFLIEGIPVGRIEIDVDPSTSPVPRAYPKIEFVLHTVSGVRNELPIGPIRLPLLLSERKLVGGSEDVALEMAGVPGVMLTVFASSCAFPDGSPTGLMSINRVDVDKVPMRPPDGVAFVPAWAVEPGGTRFDPPAAIEIPNATGLAPGTIIDLYGLEHDRFEFVNVGTGVVSEDGSVIRSDPPFGLRQAGWGGGGPRAMGSGDRTPCEESLEKIRKKRAKVIEENPNTKPFFDTLICITDQVCQRARNGRFSGPGGKAGETGNDLLNQVVPAFNDRLVDEVGRWKDVFQSSVCRGDNALVSQLCSAQMATTHIRDDLSFALRMNGCFSGGDWNTIFDIIVDCTEKNVSAPFASDITSLLRNRARNQCCQVRRGDPGCN